MLTAAAANTAITMPAAAAAAATAAAAASTLASRHAALRWEVFDQLLQLARHRSAFARKQRGDPLCKASCLDARLKQRHRRAFRALPASSACPVHVVAQRRWYVKVDHGGELRDMHTACRHVRAEKHADLPRAKLLQRVLALELAELPMQGCRFDAFAL
eukprot:6189600-Pleurochrysis_carterae.AAC.1